MASFGEVLAYFKNNEEAENIVPLADDSDLMNGLVAWKSVVITLKKADECPYMDDASKWKWLWEHVQFNEQEFGIVAGVKGQDVGRLIDRLIGLRLIYPDGTINKLAKQYLQMMILSKIRPVKSRPSVKAENSSEKTS